MTARPPALFTRAGNGLVPTDLARGPWSPELLHGGAVSALVGQLMADAVSPAFMPARLAIDFLRPVPRRPLTVNLAVLRRGRRVELLSCSVLAAGAEVCHATLLAARVPAVPRRDGRAGSALWESDQPALALRLDQPSFLGHGMQVRFAVPEDSELPGRGWFRLLADPVDGWRALPLARVAAAADMAGAVAVRRGEEMTRSIINADVRVELLRVPAGQWLRFDALASFGEAGLGHVSARIFDRLGEAGRAGSVLLDQPGTEGELWSARRWRRVSASPRAKSRT